MTASRGTILFGTLAFNQTFFFERLGAALEEQGYRAAYLCFHERSHEWLVSEGRRSYNAYAKQPAASEAVKLEDFGITEPHLLLTHEKAAYELRDSAALMRKLEGHAYATARVLDDLAADAPGGTITLVQELGGFLSVLGAHYAARARGCDSYFIEPSFFRGRVFITRNRLEAPQVRCREPRASEEVSAYLARTLQTQSTVIPTKDTHHYRKAAAKLTDKRNARRLIEKAWDKHVLGKREEFEHVGGHVRRHVRMYLNGRRLRPGYRPLSSVERFVYYPLHVPADFALTIRAPEYLDQCALIDYLCRVVPATHAVAFKEHPALIGAVPYSRVRDLLARHDNLVMLDPGTNNYDVLRKADAVVTVNSKSGAEALLVDKPVLVLGDSFYRDSAHVVRVDRLADLPGAIARALGEPPKLQADAVATYFQGVWDSSHPGELYDVSPPNVAAFAASLDAALQSR